jgi:1-acyl-sn-glycerol-3-phosphate acyltransferase
MFPITIFWCFAGYLLYVIPKRPRKRFILVWSRIFIGAANLILGLRFSVTGQEHLSALPGMIFSKHQSTWETIFLSYFIPGSTIILKKELLSIPFFGWGLRLLDPIAIDRKASIKSFKQIIKTGRKRIAEGDTIILYPEGTRVHPGEYPEFHRTGASLASGCKATIVPIVHNAGCFWPKGAFLKTPGTIEVVIGKPIETTGRSLNDINDEVYAWMKKTSQAIEK